MKAGFFMGLAQLALAENANPIRKVVTILQKMQDKVTAEGRREEELYKKYQCYCKDMKKEVAQMISEGGDKLAELKGSITKNSGAAKAAAEEVKQAQDEREASKKALKEAQAMRAKEQAEFEASSSDNKQNIEALTKAVNVLKEHGGASLLQGSMSYEFARLRKIVLVSGSLSNYEKRTVSSFLMNKADSESTGSSGEIVGIMKQLRSEFEASLKQDEAAEASASSAFQDTSAAQNRQIAAATSTIEKQQARQGQFAVAAANAKTELAETEAQYEKAVEFQKSGSAACKRKAEEWVVRQKMRSEELTTLSDVISDLNNDDSLDLFKDTLPSASRGSSFLQKSHHKKAVRHALSHLHSSKDSRMALVEYNIKQSERAASKSGKPNFANVIKMVDELVAVLKNEQKSDTKNLDRCNKDRQTNKVDTMQVENSIKTLDGSVEDSKARADVLVGDLDKLDKDIDSINKEMAKATENRKDENAEFVEAKALRGDTITLLSKVVNRLNKFYRPDQHKPEQKADESEEAVGLLLQRKVRVGYSLLQTSSKSTMAVKALSQQAPEAPFSGNYKKSGSNPVIAMLEKFVEELKSEDKEAVFDEQTAQKDYEELADRSKDSVSEKNKEIASKQIQHATTESDIADGQDSLSKKHGEHQALVKTQEQIENRCNFLESNYDLRKQYRANEMDQLVAAKAALQGASSESFLQVSEPETTKIAPFGKEDTANELTNNAKTTQDTLVDAVENAEVAEIKRVVFRQLTKLRASTIKEFDTIARLETQAIDAYNDAHHYRAENPLEHIHNDEAPIETDKLKSFH